MTILKKMKSLENKILIYGMLLVFISVFITTIACYIVSNRLVLSQFEHVNKITTGAAVEKINSYMGDISRIIHMSTKNEYFNGIANSQEADTYRSIKVLKDYEIYLQNLILYNDKIDSVIFMSKTPEFFVVASNSVGKEYNKYRGEEFYESLLNISGIKSGGQFYLDRYVEDNYERVAIIAPIFKPYENNILACMVIVLSGKFTQELQFAGDRIFITDNFENSAAIRDMGISKKLDDEVTIQSNLNFDGWKIFNTFSFDKIQDSLQDILYLNVKLGLLCITVSLIVLLIVGKRLVTPIKSMKEQLSYLNISESKDRKITVPAKKLSFKLLLLILYSVLVTIPVIIITSISYISTRNIVEREIGSVFEYSADILHQQIEFVFKNYHQIAIEISAVNSDVQEYLDAGNSRGIGLAVQEYLSRLIQANNLFGTGLENVSIYNTDYELVCTSTYGSPFMTRPDIKEDLEYISKRFGEPLWRSFTGMYFSTECFRVGIQIRGVPDSTESGKLLGYILIDFRSDDILRMFNNFLQFEDVNAYLVDSSGNSLLTGGASDSFINVIGNENLETMRSNNKRISFRNNGDSYLAVSKDFHENEWQLIFLLKNYNENKQILYVSIIVLTGLVLLSFSFSYGFSLVLYLNISSLKKAVRKVEAGDLSTRFKSITADEIGELGNCFNEMLDRVHQLIKEKYLSEMKAKDAELRATEFELNLLQAQINPHFLYNTLKTAQYMVLAEDSRAEKIIKLLIAFFKTNITHGEKLVMLSEEIANIQTYIDIQQMRFSNKFNVHIDLADDVMHCQVLKFTLQPIVENAIYHGLELLDGDCILIITAKRVDEKLQIMVKDNGIGISMEKLIEIRGQLSGIADIKGIGLTNVNGRIKLQFGDEYGIEVNSSKDMGTSVSLWLPIL